MKRYQNLKGDSGITHYKIAEDSISLKFEGSKTVYTYSNQITGRTHVEKMKELAEKGTGLSTYIAQHPEVRENYSVSK
jgi:nitrous oxidase accessory protein NosD